MDQLLIIPLFKVFLTLELTFTPFSFKSKELLWGASTLRIHFQLHWKTKHDSCTHFVSNTFYVK